MTYAKDIKVGDKFYFPHYVFPYNEVNEVIEVNIDPKAGEDVRDMFGGVVWSVPKYSIRYRGTKTQKTGAFVLQDDMSVASNYMKFVR